MTADSSASARPRLSRSLVLSALSSASAGLLLLLFAGVSRLVTQHEFGIIQYALVLAALCETLIDLGMHQITIRAVARDRAEAPRLLHNTLTLKSIPAAVVVAAASLYVVLTADNSLTRSVCLLMVLSAVPRSYLMTVRGILLGLERFGHDTLVVVLDRALLLVVGIIVLREGGGPMGLAVTFIVVRIAVLGLSLGLAGRLIGRLRLGFDTALWRDMQRAALPVGVFMVVYSFYSYIDTVMLEHMTTEVEVALYGAAYRLYEGLSYAPAVLSAVLAPRLAHLWGVDRVRHRKLTWIGLGASFGLSIVIGVPIAALARPIVVIVFPGIGDGFDYAGAVPTFRILVAGLAFIFAIWILHAAAISTFNERLLLRTTSAGAIVNAGLNLFLIPAYGRNGAALATVIGEALTTALLLVGLRHVLFPPATAPPAIVPPRGGPSAG